MLENRKVFITGGSGFIGVNLIDALLKTKVSEIISLENVTALSIKGDNRLKVISGSITDYENLRDAMKGCDTVFHLAAYADVTAANKKPIDSFKITTEGTLVALKAAVDAGVKNFIYISSARVYGNAQYRPIDEKHPLVPVEMYGAAKLSGEILSTTFYYSFDLNTANVRIFSVYGKGRIMKAGSTTGVVPTFVDKALKNQDLTVMGDGSQTKDFVHISDICKALITIADKQIGKGESFNIATGKATSIKEFAELVLELTNSKGRLIQVPSSSESVSNVADISKAKKAFGYAPTISLREGLTDFINWYKEYLAGKSTGTI